MIGQSHGASRAFARSGRYYGRRKEPRMNSTPRSFRIGAVTVTVLVESSGPLLHPAELYPDSTPEIIAAQGNWLRPHLYDAASDRLVLAMQSFLLHSGGKTILVDTCVGDCKRRVRSDFDRAEWGWLSRLQEAGVAPEQIDIVLSTHLHVDHVGWHTRLVDGNWVPTFPNARYLFVKPEYAYWRSEVGKTALERTGDYIEDSVQPVFDAGLADLVEPDHRIDASLRLVPTPGHTPGHACVEINSEGQGAMITGDLLHHPLQCCFPQWSTRFCTDPEQARATRLAFMAKHAEQGTLLFPSHFPAPTAGRLSRADAGDRLSYSYRFVDF
ncbi:Metallo-beta-lactamase superfamily protein OS=Eoetvoesiella caeni OX=645616 GN=DFR37_11531 PE=4 SV=1 [Eoetvoesiella caeni]